MSCNTKTSLAAVIDAVNAQLNNNYVDRDDPRIDQGVFTEPTIRGGLMLDEAAKLDFCGYVTECGQREPFGKQWVDRPLYPHNTLVSYEDGGEIKSRWQDIDDILAGTEFDSVADMLAINNPKDGLRVFVKGYHSGSEVGGGDFVYEASTPKSEHDGGNVFDPSKVIPDWNDRESVTTWLTPNSDGAGVYVRIGGNSGDVVNYGITGAGEITRDIVLSQAIGKNNGGILSVPATVSPPNLFSAVETPLSNVAVKGDYTSKVEVVKDLSSAIRARADDDMSEAQENVTITGTVLKVPLDGATNDYPSIWVAGVDGAMVVGNRTVGRCGIRLAYSKNPDLHSRPEIKTYHSVASNNIIRSPDLCYESFGLGNSVISSSVMVGSGTDMGLGVRMVGYGRYTSNTNYSPPHSRIVDMQARGNVYNALAIKNLRAGFSVQQGQVNNVVNAITMENVTVGMELHPSTTQDHIQERNIFSSININDCVGGIANYGQSKSIFNPFIISNFSSVALGEPNQNAGSPNENEYKLNRYSGTIVDSKEGNTDRVVRLKGTSNCYELTIGGISSTTLAGDISVSNSTIKIIAADFSKLNSHAVEITGNNNIVELNICNINTLYSVVNIKGNNNIVTVNLVHQDNVDAGLMSVVGNGNIINGKARILGGYDGSNIINVTNNSKVPLGNVTRYSGNSGITANRPEFAPVGYQFFDVTLGKPIYFKSAGVWVDSTGATV